MSLVSWLGRKITLRDGSFWAAYFGGGSHAGKTVNVQTALNVSAAWACLRRLTETPATLPLSVFQKDANGNRVELLDHPLYGLLRESPNADQTPVEFLESQFFGLGARGNCYAWRETNVLGNTTALTPIDVDDCLPHRGSAAAVVYDVCDRGRWEKDIPGEKIFHTRGFGNGGIAGLSPIGYARHSIGAALAADEAAGKVFANGLVPSLMFTPEQSMTADQRKEFRETVIEPFVGSDRAGKALVLPKGTKVEKPAFTPEDVQMLATRAFNVEDVCRWFGMPPILVGHSMDGQTMWGTGIEQIMLGWVILGLRPYLVRFEQSMKKRVLTPADRAKGIYVSFNIEGLLRGDSAARATFMSTMASNGFLTRNEGRALDNRGPLPGGDTLTVQSQMIPLDQIGQPQGTGQRQAA